MPIVQVIIVCSTLKAKTLSKPEPDRLNREKLCFQAIHVCTGFTVYVKITFLIFYLELDLSTLTCLMRP